MAMGLIIDLLSLLSFRKARTTFDPLNPEKANQLVIDGFYRFSRNPMYMGMLLIVFGYAISKTYLLGFLPVLFFLLYITRFQIKPEEEAMIKLFGDDYRSYMTKVRRWI